MRKRSKLIIGLVLIMLLVMAAGCGAKTDTQDQGTQESTTQNPTTQETTQETENKEAEVKEEVTAEEFITKMIAAADGAVVTKSDSKALLQALVGDNNNYIVIDNVYTTHNEYDKATADSTVEITCENQSGTFNAVYNLVEEQGVLYYYANQENGWVKYEACLEKEDLSRNFVSSMNLENAEILDFETEGVQYNGQDVYKLSVKLKDANIRELIFETGLQWLFWAKEYATVDLSDITVTMNYYVDPQTAQVLKVEAGLEGMKNMLTEYGVYDYSIYFGNVLDIVELHQCKLVYENISYEDYTLPKMSFEDKKSSELVHQKDTPYTLHMLDAEVEIICPAGWCVEEKDDVYLALKRVDNNIAIYYYLDYGVTMEEALNNLHSIAEGRIEEDGYISASVGAQMGVFDTYEMVREDGVEAFACTMVKNSLFTIQVFDFTTNRLEWALEDVLKRVHIAE